MLSQFPSDTESFVPPLERIRSSGKPVYLFGMGNGADKAIRLFEENGIKISGVFANEEFVRGQFFAGFKVLKPGEVMEKEPGGFAAAVCFGSSCEDMKRYIGKIKSPLNDIYCPHFPLYGGGNFDLPHFKAIREKYLRARDLVCDGVSKTIMDMVTSYYLTWDPELLFSCPAGEYGRSGMTVRRAVDGGAYTGDTAEMMLCEYPELEKIYAFEPDGYNYRKLLEYSKREPRVIPLRLGLHSKAGVLRFNSKKSRGSHFDAEGSEVPVVSLDGYLGDEGTDLIKLDVEGCESEVLDGASETIRRFAPDMLISAYHRLDDLYEIILKVESIRPGYRFSLYRKDVCPAWDIFLVCSAYSRT